MVFEFNCPSGHLLSADDTQSGMQCECPTCKVLFIIPNAPHASQTDVEASPQELELAAAPASAPQKSTATANRPRPQSNQDDDLGLANMDDLGLATPQKSAPPKKPTPPPIQPPVSSPAISNSPSLGGGSLGDELGGLGSLGDLLPGGEGGMGGDLLGDSVVHMIPCPKGHVLETPESMLDQEVICPFCNTRFFLKYANSLEAVEKRERELAARDAARGEMWFKIAIGVGSTVVLGLIIMLIMLATSK